MGGSPGGGAESGEGELVEEEYGEEVDGGYCSGKRKGGRGRRVRKNMYVLASDDEGGLVQDRTVEVHIVHTVQYVQQGLSAAAAGSISGAGGGKMAAGLGDGGEEQGGAARARTHPQTRTRGPWLLLRCGGLPIGLVSS